MQKHSKKVKSLKICILPQEVRGDDAPGELAPARGLLGGRVRSGGPEPGPCGQAEGAGSDVAIVGRALGLE